MMIAVLFLMYCFPFITCVHCREKMILSEILSFMHTLGECGKIANTHTHTRTTTGLFQFFKKKKTEKQKKTMMCRRQRYCCCCCCSDERASERTARVKQQREKLGRLAAATERKSLRVCDSNRVRKKRRERAIAVCSRA